MIVTIGGIPVYDAMILDSESGMMKISLVDDPAVMSNFQAFDSQKKMQMYQVTDEEKRLVRGVVMRADFPIYRRDENMGEYYIIYKADTIRQMAEKYLAESRQNDVNTMHQADSDVEDVNMVQYFIKGDGISVSGFDDCADGSLIAEFHVVNDDVWTAIKDGTYKGFSLEGIFDLVPETDMDEVQEIVDSLDGKFKRIFKHNSNSKSMSKLSRLKAALAKALAEFGTITTDKGVLAWDGDDDLKAGDSVYIEDAEGNRTTAEDGDYKTDDNKTIVVVDGKVSEIKDPEAEVAPVSEEMAKVSTDKGDLLYEGDEDLKEGDAVFVEKDGETVAAEDGEYTTEDGKVIKVVDGKVESITDPDAEVASEELKAKRQTFAKRLKEAFSESYSQKTSRIYDAIIAAGYTVYSWITEAGDDYAVLCYEDEETWEYKYLRFDVSWDADGNPVVSNPTEVVQGFIPADEVSETEPEPSASEEEMNRLKEENKNLKKEVEKLKKTPAAKSAHETVTTSMEASKTGNRRLDRLAQVVRAK